MTEELPIAELSSRAEAFLFAEGGTLSKRKLAQYLECPESKLAAVLADVSARLTGGITLVTSDTEASLVTAPAVSSALETAYEREMGREIGDAGLEVLAIVLYRGPSTRAQIDYIRGVNTSSTLRTLLARGLVERAGNPEDAREYLYRPTAELLAYLGVTDNAGVPQYAELQAQLKAFESAQPPLEQSHD